MTSKKAGGKIFSKLHNIMTIFSFKDRTVDCFNDLEHKSRKKTPTPESARCTFRGKSSAKIKGSSLSIKTWQS
ncbi:unnamed protein product [Brassica rapa subsp. narinosa]